MVNIQDVDHLVVNKVRADFKTSYSTGSFYTEYVEKPATFPCVCMYLIDNYTYRPTQSTDNVENHANLSYQVVVRSDKQNQNKQEAESIKAIIENAMEGMQFTRISSTVVPDENRSIYQIIGRYTAIVEKGKDVNGTTVYQMYRSR